MQRETTKAGVELNAIDEVARRLESVCESLRVEIGRDAATQWTGLSGQSPQRSPGEESTQRLARDLGEAAHVPQGGQALVLAFLLRQLEIAMSLLSRASGEIVELKERVSAIERNLGSDASIPGQIVAPGEAI